VEPDRALYQKFRKRMLMFYFLTGINLFMGFAVLTGGPGKVDPGTLAVIVLIFFGFAVINVYMARMLKKQWSKYVQEQSAKADGDLT